MSYYCKWVSHLLDIGHFRIQFSSNVRVAISFTEGSWNLEKFLSTFSKVTILIVGRRPASTAASGKSKKIVLGIKVVREFKLITCSAILRVQVAAAPFVLHQLVEIFLMIVAVEALVRQIEVERQRVIPVGLVFADLARHREDRLPLLLVSSLKDSCKFMELAGLVRCQHFPNPLYICISLFCLGL